MRSGKLRHRVTIKEKSVSQNAFGEEVITWTDVVTLWARISPLRGREYIEARQVQADVTTKIVTRHYPGIGPSMRVVHNGRTFEIVAPPINPDERDIQMELLCREEINN